MNTGTAHIALKHLGKLDGVTQTFIVRCGGLLYLRDALQHVAQIHLAGLAVGIIGQAVRNSLAEVVGYVQRYLKHTCHILDCHLGSHGAVGDDMGHLLLSVLLGHPLKHAAAAVIIKVHIDIRE